MTGSPKTIRAPSQPMISRLTSGLTARLASISSRPRSTHSDPKEVFEGLDGLALCAALGDANQMATLLTRDHNPDQKDCDGDRYPIHWAAARGHRECLLLLLRSGANPSVLDAEGRTAVEVAADDAKIIFSSWEVGGHHLFEFKLMRPRSTAQDSTTVICPSTERDLPSLTRTPESRSALQSHHSRRAGIASTSMVSIEKQLDAVNVS